MNCGRRRLFVWAWPLLISALGCQPMTAVDQQASLPSSANGTSQFESVRKIMVQSCVVCHSTFGSMSEQEFISNAYVVPGQPTSSLLYQRLKGANTGGGQENMPTAGALSSSDLSSIRDWITQIGSTPPPSTGGGPSALERRQSAFAVIANKCASCHNTTVVAASARYTGATVPAFAKFVDDGSFVVSGMAAPQKAQTSWIYSSLKTYGGIATMPKDGPALTADEAGKIEAWINGIGLP